MSKPKTRLPALASTCALAMVAVLATAPSATADYHLTKIREIKGEGGASPNTSFIELQMYAAGQNFVSGHEISIWNSSGVVGGMVQPVQTFTLTGPNPPNGQNQRTILIGDTAVPGADFTLSDLSTYLGDNTLRAAGAVCFHAIPVDCVSWGGSAMVGPMNLPDKTLPYGEQLPVTFSLQRRIDRGCPTLLEAIDDTNDAQSDFRPKTPADPTPNSATPVEFPCAGPVPEAFCGGLRATIAGDNTSEVLKGTARRDIIAGRGGNDVIRGLRGNDVLCGGRGNDRLVGGRGKDRLLGQRGRRDVCKGGPGKDRAKGCEVKISI